MKKVKLFPAALTLSTVFIIVAKAPFSSAQPTEAYNLSKVTELNGLFENKKYQNQWQLVFSSIESYKKHVDRKQFLQRVYDEQTKNVSSERDKILSVLSYVQSRLYATHFVPIDENKKAILDPLILHDIRWSSCGQANRFLVDLLAVGGHDARLLQLNGHVAASVKLDGEWRFLDADALTSGIYIKNKNGDLATIYEVSNQPELSINTPINWEVNVINGTVTKLSTYQSLNVFKSVEYKFRGKKLTTPFFYIKNTKSENFTYENRYYGWNYLDAEVVD